MPKLKSPVHQSEECTQHYESSSAPWSTGPASSSPKPPAMPPQHMGSPMKTIPKQGMLQYVMVDAQSEDSPTRQEGWMTWLQAVKDQARPPINLWADPPLQTRDIYRLLSILRPIRIELGLAKRHGLYTDKLFDGWMPSRYFYITAEAKGGPNARDLCLALPIIQFPTASGVRRRTYDTDQGCHGSRRANFGVHQGKHKLFFVRLHPALSFARVYHHTLRAPSRGVTAGRTVRRRAPIFIGATKPTQNMARRNTRS